MFHRLQEINRKPQLFECYTVQQLWNDEHISKGMLAAHLNPQIDAASRNKNFVDRSIDWMISHFNIDRASSIVDFNTKAEKTEYCFYPEGGFFLVGRIMFFAQSTSTKSSTCFLRSKQLSKRKHKKSSIIGRSATASLSSPKNSRLLVLRLLSALQM